MKAKEHIWFQQIGIVAIQLAFKLWFGYRVIGRENIPAGGCVVCANHNQTSDPPLAAAAIGVGHPIAVMAKKELFTVPLFSRLITWLGAFPVDRGRADITAIKTSLRALKEGKKMLIFPQGTRGTEEDGAKEGAAMLAVRTGSPILPVYIAENKRFACRPYVVIGKAYAPPEKTRDYGPIADDILRRIYALREEIPK